MTVRRTALQNAKRDFASLPQEQNYDVHPRFAVDHIY